MVVGGTFSAIYSLGGWCWFSFVVDVVAVIVLLLLLLLVVVVVSADLVEVAGWWLAERF